MDPESTPSDVEPLGRDAAALGLPVPKRRFLRRSMVRIAWPLLRHQIDFNHSVEDQLEELRKLHQEASAIAHQQTARAHHMQQAMTRLATAVESVRGELSMAIAQHEEALQISRDQTFARYVEANGIMRRELGEVMLELNEFRSTYSMGMASIMPKMAALELAFDTKTRLQPDWSAAEQPPPVDRDLDAFYVALAEAFRGPEVLVRSRVRAYLPDLEAVRQIGTVLDVGCGRGEMLEVLREANLDAYGIDINSLCVQECQERGLTVELIGAREHFASIPPSSLGAVVALHVVEHLPLEDLIEFIDLAMIALKPGGMLILETPNPENVLVSTLYFYLDPSHRHPIPPPLLQFLLASRGIVDLEVRRLSRDEVLVQGPSEGDPWFGDVQVVVDAFNDRFACPPDYAILARRP